VLPGVRKKRGSDTLKRCPGWEFEAHGQATSSRKGNWGGGHLNDSERLKHGPELVGEKKSDGGTGNGGGFSNRSMLKRDCEIFVERELSHSTP